MTLDQVNRAPRFRGRAEMAAHLAGKRLTLRQICLAKCFECMGGYADGPFDCGIAACAIYPKMPYRDKWAPESIPCPPRPLNQPLSASSGGQTVP